MFRSSVRGHRHEPFWNLLLATGVSAEQPASEIPGRPPIKATVESIVISLDAGADRRMLGQT